MNRNGSFWAAVSLACVLIAPGSRAATYYLDADGGSDGNAGTSPGAAWATLSKASSRTFLPGDRILLQCGDTFAGKLELQNDSGTAPNPVVVASYGFGARPVIDAAGYLAGVHISNTDYITVRDLEITADGGAPVDGSDPSKRYGVYASTSSGDTVNGITLSNLYIHAIYPHTATANEGVNPTTYMGTAVEVKGQSSIPSSLLVVQKCQFEDLGFRVLSMTWMNWAKIIDNTMTNIGGPAMVPNQCDDLLVQGNVVHASGAYTDPRMHGRGSGIWPIRCDRVLIEHNAFMHARGRYDSCGAHIDIGCNDVVIQYNLSMDNEGGFVEILGENNNCAYRYNISVNDGARRAGTQENGLPIGDGHVFLFSGHNGTTNRAGPYNSYVYNNTIYVKQDQPCSFSIEAYADGILVANNLFFIDGPAEDGTPSWWGAYPPGIEDTVVWTNNLYQRGGIFPDWIFHEGHPIYGNPNLPNPGGLSPEDYIPPPGAFVQGRGIAIPKIPGDPLGLAIGLAATNDFFGNPIQGLPDIGAVEVGGGVSTNIGVAFMGLPVLSAKGDAVYLSAVAGPAGAEYDFRETTGNHGGTDSGWQSGTNHVDAGLLPNTPYAYELLLRQGSLVSANTSVLYRVATPVRSPFIEHVLLDEDFSTAPNPVNVVSPFPLNTWYLDDAQIWSRESQDAAVSTQSGALRLGWGYDEVLVQFYRDVAIQTGGEYRFSGDWLIPTVFENHVGFLAGVGEYDSTTGLLLKRIKQITVGELGAPFVGQTGSFELVVSSAELQAAGVAATNRIGIFLHRDDDGILYSESSAKNDIYHVDNLLLLYFGDNIDTDGDGIPDTTETMEGLDPDDPSDGLQDADADGIPNTEEYLLGTGMSDSNGLYQTSLSVSPTEAAFSIPDPYVLSNRVYILEHKPSLLAPDSWRAVDGASGTAAAGSGAGLLLHPTTEDQSFYRLRVEWE